MKKYGQLDYLLLFTELNSAYLITFYFLSEVRKVIHFLSGNDFFQKVLLSKVKTRLLSGFFL
jgi:hypothetical protein